MFGEVLKKRIDSTQRKVEKMKRSCVILTTLFCVLLTAMLYADKSKTGAEEKDYSKDPIIPLLAFDAIPAIKDPSFVSAADAKLGDDAPVIGVSFNGEHHAYSIYLLNGHEIVNDVVGGAKIATTW